MFWKRNVKLTCYMYMYMYVLWASRSKPTNDNDLFQSSIWLKSCQTFLVVRVEDRVLTEMPSSFALLALYLWPYKNTKFKGKMTGWRPGIIAQNKHSASLITDFSKDH